MKVTRFKVPLYGSTVAIIISDDSKRAYTWANKYLGFEIDDGECGAWTIGNRDRGRFVVCFKNAIIMHGARSTDYLCHEVRHLTDDILLSVGCRIRAGSEEAAYLQGWLGGRIYRAIYD